MLYKEPHNLVIWVRPGCNPDQLNRDTQLTTLLEKKLIASYSKAVCKTVTLAGIIFIYYPVKPYIKEFCTVIYLISLTTGLISRYHPRKNQRNILLVPKEGLIGDHNLKPLLTVNKESINW